MHAIVIGGGLTGLMAARALADTGARVTLFERDTYPSTPEGRDGAPQGQHVHVLLRRGYELLCRRIPALADDLAAAGAPRLDLTNDLVYHGPAGLTPRFASGFEVVLPSRHLLEWLVRQRIAADARISLREQVWVDGLVASPGGGQVVGVWVRGAAGPTQVAADLVVDASGRSSSAPKWLVALGRTAPSERMVPTQTAYATRWYRTASPPQDWRGIAALPAMPDGCRAGFINAAESERFIVTLAGIKGHVPPVDDAGFLAFAASLHEPQIAAFIATATPLGPIRAWRKMGNRLRCYHQLRDLPGGFVALGDAFCAFNPVYGQGITVGMLGAETLADAVAKAGGAVGSPRFVRTFFARLHRVVAVPWLMATSQDLRHGSDGQATAADMFTRWSSPLMDEFMRLTTRDPEAFLTFLQVVHMVRSPAALAHPRFFPGIVRGLWQRLRA